jgi:acyl-coenzyme A thioesterase PaaI-like protein
VRPSGLTHGGLIASAADIGTMSRTVHEPHKIK